MSNTHRDSPQFSDTAERLLDERVSSGLRSRPEASPDIARLVRYLCGALSSTEVHLVERSLTTNASLRQQQRKLYAELEALQQMTWAEVVARAEANDLVAQAWSALVIERTAAAERASADKSVLVGTTLQRGVRTGLAEAQSIWTAFAAFREQLRLSLQIANTQPALVRGGSDWSEVRSVGLPEGIGALLRCETQTDGLLQVSLLLNDAQGQPFLAASGLAARLELELEGEAWPLGECTLEQNRGEWTVELFDQELAPITTQLRADVFRVVVGDPVVISDTDASSRPSIRRLYVTVEDSEGYSLSDRPIRLIMEGSAHIESGLLHVTLSLPAAVREIYGEYLLVLDAGITVEHWQRLGAWPVGDWGGEARTLRIPCPDLIDSEALAVPLRVGLRSSE